MMRLTYVSDKQDGRGQFSTEWNWSDLSYVSPQQDSSTSLGCS